MKDEIIAHINNPQQLEKMYRANKVLFRRSFSTLYPELESSQLTDFWKERLSYESDEINWGSGRELLFVIIASLLAGFIAKLPAFLGISEDVYYQRNVGFIVFPFLAAYFAWKNKLPVSRIAVMTSVMFAGLLFINLLPGVAQDDTFLLSCFHLLIVLWSVVGFAFVGDMKDTNEKRLGYLKYNGDLVVMTTLIVIAGGIMTAITIGLFSLIGFKIERFYFEYVVVFGLPAAPIVGTYLIQANPQLVGKVSPVIARIFSPLVLAMLLIYLGAMVYSRKDPFNDRDFLLIFNALLIGVMALIFFSVAETTRTTKSRFEIWVLFLLSVLTIFVNGVALSAILFRISEWGLTANRAAVLGGNVLILINLFLVTTQLFSVMLNKVDQKGVEKAITRFLPFYILWAAVVTFLFPFLFGFK